MRYLGGQRGSFGGDPEFGRHGAADLQPANDEEIDYQDGNHWFCSDFTMTIPD